MTTLTLTEPTPAPSYALPLYVPGARRDGTLGTPIVRGEAPGVEAELSAPTAGPPGSFKLDVKREKRRVRGTCRVRVGVFNADTRGRLFSIEVPMRDRIGLTLAQADCIGTTTVLYPAALAATQNVYLVLDDGEGELGRSAPFRLADLARSGASSPYVQQEGNILDRAAAAARRTGDAAEGTFNKMLWAGGIAGGVVLLMLSRH